MSLPRYRLAMPSRLVWSMEESPLINCFFWSMDGSHLIDCTAAGPFGIVVGCPAVSYTHLTLPTNREV